MVNKRELTELNYKHLTAGGSGEERISLLKKDPTFTPKIAVGKLCFGNSERMKNYTMKKSENNSRICAHFKITSLDK